MTARENRGEVRSRLFKAIEAGEVEEVRDLLQLDARLARQPNAEGASPLLWAAYYRQREICKLLLDHGAEADVFEASALDLDDRVKELLRADRSWVERYSYDGWTPLHLAGHFGSVKVMRTLIANGASHRAVSRNSNGNQPLQAAAAGRQVEAVKMLLKVGADVNARSEGGFTAIHIAAANGDEVLARALLGAGAVVDVRAEGGKTPMDIAIDADHGAIVDLLETTGSGGRPDAPDAH